VESPEVRLLVGLRTVGPQVEEEAVRPEAECPRHRHRRPAGPAQSAVVALVDRLEVRC
jgi:hypothetical protein